MRDSKADRAAVEIVRRLVHHNLNSNTTEALLACECRMCRSIKRVCYLAMQSIGNNERKERKMKRVLIALALFVSAGLAHAQTCCTKIELLTLNPLWHHNTRVPMLIPLPKLNLHDSVRVQVVGTWDNGVKTVLTPTGGVVRAAALLLLLPAPDHATIGQPIVKPPTIQVLNPEGLPIAAPGIMVAVSSNGSRLGGTATGLTNVQGRVTFTNLILLDTTRTTLTFYVPATPSISPTASPPIRPAVNQPVRRG